MQNWFSCAQNTFLFARRTFSPQNSVRARAKHTFARSKHDLSRAELWQRSNPIVDSMLTSLSAQCVLWKSVLTSFSSSGGLATAAHPIRVQAIFWDRAEGARTTAHARGECWESASQVGDTVLRMCRARPYALIRGEYTLKAARMRLCSRRNGTRSIPGP